MNFNDTSVMANAHEKTTIADTPDLDKRHGLNDDSSVGMAHHAPVLSAKEGRRLTLKIDLKVMPVLGMFKTKIQGLERGLNFPNTGFNTSFQIFYTPFVLAEVPLNMLMSLPQV
ncbi:hypothetical protein BJ878DRAFT_538198 [Calycina marina]|uniref:Uncharacterized protein n=1 Tax=Calycina marina TaxID=1763456 RepID=A0A9P7ZB46_9HELO|nr:hypothetical protein BJ878DRAFT_538198 [Calycina marina]